MASNGDEARFLGVDGEENYIGNFHKGLPHDDVGEVIPAAYRSLLTALDQKAGFDRISLGLGRKLVNPQGGLATDVEGPDPSRASIPAAPSLDSAEAAAEAVELYWMALLRDEPFVKFDSDPGIDQAAQELSTLTDFTGPKLGGRVTPQTIFRGCFSGDIVGPPVSQYLLHDVPIGSLKVRQRQVSVFGEPVVGPGRADYLTQFDQWLAAQRGQPAFSPDKLDRRRRYIQTMRDACRYVQVDGPYQAYLNACLQLLDAQAPVDDGVPYRPEKPDGKTQIGFATFGGPHVLTLLAEVATRALKAIFFQKWSVHRRLRPEAYGGLIEVMQNSATVKNYPIHPQVLNSKALAETRRRFGSFLLPQAYPEGSPTHPSYGAGHAAVAGACVTILKAWFKAGSVLPLAPVVPSDDGRTLVAYTGPDAGQLTIGGELNKLATNIAVARNMAGVHYRSDFTAAAKLGEQVALCVLKKQSLDFNEEGWFFKLIRFDDTLAVVRKGEVVDEDGNPLGDLPC